MLKLNKCCVPDSHRIKGSAAITEEEKTVQRLGMVIIKLNKNTNMMKQKGD
jgi:hypothetical protein